MPADAGGVPGERPGGRKLVWDPRELDFEGISVVIKPGKPATLSVPGARLEIPRDALRGRWPGTEEVWCTGLLDLELAGLIRRLPGGRLARTIWRT